MNFRSTGLIQLALVVLILPGCGKKDDNGVITLKLGHALDIEHPVHKALLDMADRLEKKSGGKVVLKVFPGGQLGSEETLIKQLQLGLVDMAKVSTSPLEGFVSIYSVFSVPYLFKNNTHFWNVLDGTIGKQLLQAGEDKGLKGLCYYDAGSRSFYTKDKPINNPDDLKGMKIRVMNSSTAIKMMEELGAAATPIPWGELYTSLQQGVVDGAENNPPSFYRSSHYEVCKYYSLTEHTTIPDIVLISMKTWNKLTPEVQKMIQEAADESKAYQRKLWEEESDKDLKKVEEEGVKVFYPDKEPFREKVKEMQDSYKGTEVGDLIKQIKEVQY
jgi:tripartite ATP-independent transporter DctP family solute receptor